MLVKLDGIYKIAHGHIPEDAKVVGMQYIADRDSLYVVLESDYWEEFAEGCSILHIPLADAPCFEKVGNL
jgi:hypothetical protein